MSNLWSNVSRGNIVNITYDAGGRECVHMRRYVTGDCSLIARPQIHLFLHDALRSFGGPTLDTFGASAKLS